MPLPFFQEPIHLIAARDALRADRTLEAAKMLLSSPQKEHRSIQLVLREIQPKLVSEAMSLLEHDTQAASEYIDCAAKCGEYSLEIAVIVTDIRQQIEEHRARKQYECRQIEKAEHLAAQGRVVTAMGVLPKEAAGLDTGFLRADLEERQARFQRYLNECTEYLDRGEISAAKVCLLKAKELIPNHPDLLVLNGRFPIAEHPQELAMTRYITKQDRGICFGESAVIFFKDYLIAGTGRKGAECDLPYAAKLHRQHVVFRRSSEHGFTVEPIVFWDEKLHRDVRCEVFVNDIKVCDERPLQHGELVTLGDGAVSFRFHKPIDDVDTAVLIPVNHPPIQGAKWSKKLPIVMMGSHVLISPSDPAHLIEPRLPAKNVLLGWNDHDRLVADSGTIRRQRAAQNTEVEIMSEKPFKIVSSLTDQQQIARTLFGETPRESQSWFIRPLK